MKRKILECIVVLGLVVGSASSMAIMIDDSRAGGADGTDVGFLDILLTEQAKDGKWDPKNNPAGEKEWAEDFLGFEIDYSGKTETVDIFDTDTANVRAFSLAFEPGYFIVKNSTHRALYENLAGVTWGVINISALDGGFNLGGTTISHVTEFNGDETTPDVPMPVPGTLFLLGLGLLGVRFARAG